MDEVSGRGWRLVVAGGDWPSSQLRTSLPMTVVRLGEPPYQELECVAARWFEQHACRAAIVRPDHYVWGVAQTPQAMQAQLDLLNSQIDPRRPP